MTNTAAAISISDDELAIKARQHIDFLRELHKQGVTLTTPSHQCLHRYLNHWLPLVAEKHQHDDVRSPIPPPDMAWLWHCHRLAPSRYDKHCIDRFERVLDPSPHQVFEVQIDSNNHNDNNTEKINNKFEEIDVDEFLKEFDLIGSCERQAGFLWQVSAPNFTDQAFLEQGAKKYIQFLHLFQRVKQKYGSDAPPVVPTYQMDLIWHTHILMSTQNYKKDCIQICGEPLHHDDSLNDRSDGGALQQAFQQTSKEWTKLFDEEYYVEGGMYRGEPPKEYWKPTWVESNDFCVVTLNDKTNIPLVLAGSISAGVSEDPYGNTPKETSVASSSQPPAGLWPMCSPFHQYEGKATMIEVNLQSKAFAAKGLEMFPPKKEYIFGAPVDKSGTQCSEMGYYHIYTKEAFEIMIDRLEKQAAKAQREYDDLLFHIYCGSCFCRSKAGIASSSGEDQALDQKKEACNKASVLCRVAKAQYEMKGPGAPLSESIINTYGLQNVVKTTPLSSSEWIPKFAAAAACGGKNSNRPVKAMTSPPVGTSTFLLSGAAVGAI